MGFGTFHGFPFLRVLINNPILRLRKGRIANSPQLDTPTYTLTVS